MSRKPSVPGGEGATATPPSPNNSLLATPTTSNSIPKSPKPPTPTNQNSKSSSNNSSQPIAPAKGQTSSQPNTAPTSNSKDKTAPGKAAPNTGQNVYFILLLYLYDYSLVQRLVLKEKSKRFQNPMLSIELKLDKTLFLFQRVQEDKGPLDSM